MKWRDDMNDIGDLIFCFCGGTYIKDETIYKIYSKDNEDYVRISEDNYRKSFAVRRFIFLKQILSKDEYNGLVKWYNKEGS
jgi:glycopeptide antibiotics resistance protein